MGDVHVRATKTWTLDMHMSEFKFPLIRHLGNLAFLPWLTATVLSAYRLLLMAGGEMNMST